MDDRRDRERWGGPSSSADFLSSICSLVYHLIASSLVIISQVRRREGYPYEISGVREKKEESEAEEGGYLHENTQQESANQNGRNQRLPVCSLCKLSETPRTPLSMPSE